MSPSRYLSRRLLIHVHHILLYRRSRVAPSDFWKSVLHHELLLIQRLKCSSLIDRWVDSCLVPNLFIELRAEMSPALSLDFDHLRPLGVCFKLIWRKSVLWHGNRFCLIDFKGFSSFACTQDSVPPTL